LVSKYSDVFAEKLVGSTAKVPPLKLNIKPGESPYCAKARSYAPKETLELQKKVSEFLSQGLIKECVSEWNSNAMIVPKANGKWRLVIDYRGLNEKIEYHSYNMPKIRDLIHNLASKKYFACFDFCSRYDQIPLSENSKPYMVFSTPHGKFAPNGI